MDLPNEDTARFCGLEFDWFAVDAAGAMGLFATGGWGDIPVEVARHAQQHQQLAAQLALPNLGSLAVWDDFARYGCMYSTGSLTRDLICR